VPLAPPLVPFGLQTADQGSERLGYKPPIPGKYFFPEMVFGGEGGDAVTAQTLLGEASDIFAEYQPSPIQTDRGREMQRNGSAGENPRLLNICGAHGN